MKATAPLEGLVVADLTQYVAGAYCTQFLGDLGADVIKVELPGAGDPYRYQGPEYVNGESTLFLALNRNKRSAAIDWKQPAGRAVLEKLIEKSDLVVENARPGALAKYGLDYESLSDRYPALVYCSISGFGQTGAYAGRGGFDLILQGEGGLMSLTGERGGGPVKVGAPVLDIGSAICAVVAVLAALRRRDVTGEGSHVETSLLDFSLASLSTVAQAYFASGVEPERLGSGSPSFAPYQSFAVGDEYMTIAGSGSEDLWRRFCDVLGRPDWLTDARFKTNAQRVANQDELVPLIEAQLKTRSREEWLAAFDAAGVPAGRINTLESLFADPHVRERGGAVAMEHAAYGNTRGVNAPLRMAGESIEVRCAPPLLGEHTDAVLAELGVGLEEVERLRKEGIVG